MTSFGIRRLLLSSALIRKNVAECVQPKRNVVTNDVGGILEQPSKKGFRGMVSATVIVCTGVSIGAAISKDVAGFLEENELFVPSDDDDD